jgi:hypothetical protein
MNGIDGHNSFMKAELKIAAASDKKTGLWPLSLS